ncbi:hypothetical protein EJ05DRAFT_484425 [Pseudovirgaria hyperparasitica]|uniref:Xylanolytic transcriptional activator regulatory domain-containing protein n=1 Tax=Pseudovirgaria hyperparasitica TaxID=470096 RepID=A0A6A6W9X0_9PEZI|nr:uncharacterized protein EJ05DRAFT_484425 [Pseudovirgaria hyperparasitica]KAF2759473.1 hypothetical protein EJ05DRAFT_484425 [Pseudovirgaria hyperparasitica]
MSKETSSTTTAELLLEKLRSLPEHETQALVHQIREGDDMDALAASLRNNVSIRSSRSRDSEPQEGDLSSYMAATTFLNGGVSRVFGSTSGMGQVKEPDSETGYRSNVVASYDTWTNVTKDGDFVRHLLQTYFEIWNPYYNFIPQKPFWDSFNVGSTKYCSPLLVNAVCALACHASDLPGARTVPSDHRTSGDHFFVEARRILFDDETPCITSVQALSIMALREPAAGRDSSGYMYAGRCLRMSLELGLHLRYAGPDKLDPVEEEVRNVTFWACFCFETAWTLCVGRTSQLPRAAITSLKPVPKEPLHSDPRGSLPSPTPSITGKDATTDSTESRHILYHLSTLSELANDNVFTFYAPQERFTSRKLLDCFYKYESWYRGLPKAFRVDQKAQSPPSRAVLELSAWYQACLIMLFRPLIKVSLTNSDVVPRDVCLNAANEITRLMRIYRNSYGFRRVNTILSHINLSCSMIHLINIQYEDSKLCLIQDMKNLEDMSESAYFAARAFRTICALAEQWKAKIPPEVLQNSKLVPSDGAIFSPVPNGPFIESSHTSKSTAGGQSTPDSQAGTEPRLHPHSIPVQHPPMPQQPQAATHPPVNQPIASMSDLPNMTAQMHFQPHFPFPAPADGKPVLASHPSVTSVTPSHRQQQPHMHDSTQANHPPVHPSSYKPSDASAAQQLFWSPFGGNTTPLLGNNINVSPMDLSNMLGNVDTWEQLGRDGFSLTEWNSQPQQQPQQTPRKDELAYGVQGVPLEAPSNAGGWAQHGHPHMHVQAQIQQQQQQQQQQQPYEHQQPQQHQQRHSANPRNDDAWEYTQWNHHIG